MTQKEIWAGYFRIICRIIFPFRAIINYFRKAFKRQPVTQHNVMHNTLRRFSHRNNINITVNHDELRKIINEIREQSKH